MRSRSRTPSPAYAPDGKATRTGAPHGADVAYAFDNLRYADRPWTAADQHVADTLATYWINFAKTGNPNGNGLPEWPAYDAKAQLMIDLGDEPSAKTVIDLDALEYLGSRERSRVRMPRE